MTTQSNDRSSIIRHVDASQLCCDEAWERAYRRFESRDEEIEKFRRRLTWFGLQHQPKHSRIIELFCGRGAGLIALQRLGFQNLVGVDLSESLLEQYDGDLGQMHLADCRDLPFDDDAFDIAIVQGGLHHLVDLPDDLAAVMAQIHRVLQPRGTLLLVEPWLTPFLSAVHRMVSQPWVRRIYSKGDALATMIDHERTTYEQWLNQPQLIRSTVDRFFHPIQSRTRWGKWMFQGSPRESSCSPSTATTLA